MPTKKQFFAVHEATQSHEWRYHHGTRWCKCGRAQGMNMDTLIWRNVSIRGKQRISRKHWENLRGIGWTYGIKFI